METKYIVPLTTDEKKNVLAPLTDLIQKCIKENRVDILAARNMLEHSNTPNSCYLLRQIVYNLCYYPRFTQFAGKLLFNNYVNTSYEELTKRANQASAILGYQVTVSEIMRHIRSTYLIERHEGIRAIIQARVEECLVGLR